MRMLALLAAAVVTMTCSTTASAANYLYALSGTNGANYSATWQLSSKPTPDAYTSNQGFSLDHIAGNFPGASNGVASFDFFSSANDGGLSIFDADTLDLLLTLTGAQLYTGNERTPTLRLGTFSLTGDNGARYSLKVTNATAGAVPEPVTWAMMIVGFAAVGGAMRTRRTAVRFA